jgi:hypothetical protein
MSRIVGKLKRCAIFVHGWMGVGFCLIFLLWFSSGIVLIYRDYPTVSSADRIEHALPLDPSQIKLSAAQAFARLQSLNSPIEVHLVSFDRRPAYRFRFGRDSILVYADNGEIRADFPSEVTSHVASAWTGQPTGSARAETLTQADQWTVSGEFRSFRPIRKYTWPDGEEVYVSTVTGEVVQYTTGGSRVGAYFGAIPHWLYFTPLRKHARAWSRVVIWVSGLGIVVSLLGLVLGVWMYSPSKDFRHDGEPSRIPYEGQKRWHMILGLLFGPVACLWAFSGMLSMDPFPGFQGASDERATRIESALREEPIQLTAFDAKTPEEALRQLAPDLNAKELELVSFSGEPTYLATISRDDSRIIPVHGEPVSEFDFNRVVDVFRKAAVPGLVTESRLVTRYEAYYVDRRDRLPLPAIFVRLNDAGNSTYYVDPRTAQIVQSYDSRSRINRWLRHGLHSLDLPWLYRHRPAWDILILMFMFGGTVLTFTALILASRVVRRSI